MSGPRLACLYVPALPLQLLAQRPGSSPEQPLAVIAGDAVRPLSTVAAVNRAAQRGGVVCGMRLTQARALLPALHADTVPATAIAAAVAALAPALLRLTPGVEPAAGLPGLFWLDPNGLQRLYADVAWAAALTAAAASQRLRCRVAMGFNRCYLQALICAAGAPATRICASAAAEHQLAVAVPIAALHLEPGAAQALLQLGVHTLGELLRLPAAGLAQRLGPTVAALHRLGRGQVTAPLRAYREPPVDAAACAVEPADDDAGRLLFGLKALLPPLLAAQARRGEACVGLCATLDAGGGRQAVLEVAPARPSRDTGVLLELLRLRLAATVLPGPVEHIALRLHGAALAPGQATMLLARPRRDVAAAGAALARLRAAFGAAAVTCARLCPQHAPEARYRWEPMVAVCLPQARPAPLLPPLMRQLWPRPQALMGAEPAVVGRWLGAAHGTVAAVSAPTRLSAAWWTERPLEREYRYVFTQRAGILWAFHDRPAARWFIQGRVD